MRVLPTLLIVFGLAVDLAMPPGYSAAPLFAAAALVAAPLSSLRVTIWTGVAACLAMLPVQVLQGSGGPIEAATEKATVLTVAGLAVLINRVVVLGDRRLASARGIAEAAQRAVLPFPAPRAGRLGVAARYMAAQADARIGGDLFAVQNTPYGVRLVIGDVRGKGTDAIDSVVVVLGAFREAAEQEPDLEGVARRLDRALSREGARRGIDAVEGFATAVLAEISDGGEKLRLVNRGHPDPLLLCPGQSPRLLEPGGRALPLGLIRLHPGDSGDSGPPDESGRSYAAEFPPGATLLFYTDGLSEARDAYGVFLDPVEQLRDRPFTGPDDLLDLVIDTIGRHTGSETADDTALLAVTRPV
ncbi:PP2C family protein-serine/threonine phosphatase [Streptomyces scopuliridis]|uniref:PP2C family protein-serine/threonine phosphatase n=1 Tax=Streptomyces scopuliridis TaxID=452529 RepID=UPI0036BEE007